MSTHCLVCKKRLKNPLSMEIGIGPVCRGRRVIEEKGNKQGELFMVDAIPDFGDVVCSREGGDISTNVPRRITKHSPTGFEWGYGGSGPADFALNILSVFIGQKLAEFYYQDFKWEFVSKLPDEGGTIHRETILDWLDKKMPKEKGEKNG